MSDQSNTAPAVLARRLREQAERWVGDGWGPEGPVALLREAADALKELVDTLAAAGAVVEACQPFVDEARRKETIVARRGWTLLDTVPVCVTLGDCRAALRAVRAWEREHG